MEHILPLQGGTFLIPFFCSKHISHDGHGKEPLATDMLAANQGASVLNSEDGGDIWLRNVDA
jgi:hypothetical protein